MEKLKKQDVKFTMKLLYLFYYEQSEWMAWLHRERLQVGGRNKNKSLMIIKLKNG